MRDVIAINNYVLFLPSQVVSGTYTFSSSSEVHTFEVGFTPKIICTYIGTTTSKRHCSYYNVDTVGSGYILRINVSSQTTDKIALPTTVAGQIQDVSSTGFSIRAGGANYVNLDYVVIG